MKLTRRLTTRVNDELAAAIEAAAELDRRTPSDWIRLALTDLLAPLDPADEGKYEPPSKA